MFVSGKIRGNAPQLGSYLLTKGKNERFIILDVDGRPNADEAYLKNLLYSMELNSELTRSNNSVYHSIINPDPDSQQDRAMTMDEWRISVKTHVENLKCEQQRSATVLHELNGRFHAHIVIERYNHETGTMVDFKHNYAAHDKTRFQLEKQLGHSHTPKKNIEQPKHKKTLTAIWNETKTGEAFIKRAKIEGYLIAKGTDRPFRVIDKDARSFDLVRQLDKIKTKEIHERMQPLNLMSDKEAIAQSATLKKQRENADTTTNNVTSKNINKKMNWDNLISGKNISIYEIDAKREGKLELLEVLKNDAQKTLSGKELHKQLLMQQQQVKKIEEIADREIDRGLEAMYNYQETNKLYSENITSITTEQIPINSDKYEFDGIVLFKKQEWERFEQEIQEARRRNRTQTFEK